MPAYTTESEGSAGRRDVLAALVFLGLALVVTYLPPGQQQGIASALRASVLRPFVATQEGLVATRQRAVESGQLRGQLDSLVAVMSAHQTTVEENRRLRALLSLSERVGPMYRPASVIRAGTAGSESMFLLNVGEDAGVRPNVPVITRHGLLGMIRQVRGGTSIGMDWTHPDFRASAMTLDGTVFGIVESRRGDFREDDRLLLNGTAFHATLDEGTVIVTSGLGVYPRGIPIGTVEELAEAEAGWRKSYWLTPFVNPGGATHVLVATASEEGGPPGDLSAAWPEDSIVTFETLSGWDQARRDSLAALGDSVLILRQLLMAYELRDSAAFAAMDQAQRDSVARAQRAAAAAAAARVDSPAARPTLQGPSSGGAQEDDEGAAARTDPPPPVPRETQPPAITPPAVRPALPGEGQPDTAAPAAPTPLRPGDDPPAPADTIPPADTLPPVDTLGVAHREEQGGAPPT